MKYVTVHEPIQILNLVNETPAAEPVQVVDKATGNLVYEKDDKGEYVMKPCKPWSFYDVLARFVFSDKTLSVKGKALAKFVKRMTKAFKKASASDVVVVDDSDVEVLKKICETNEWGSVNAQLGDFFDAVDDASDEDPRKTKET